MRKKEDYVVIGLGVILMTIVFALSYYAYQDSKPKEQENIELTEPTPVPQRKPSAENQNTEEVVQPLVRFNSQAQNRLLDKVNQRPVITSDDSFAKAKILALLPPNESSGILYETQSIRIEYVSSADLFQVEILSTDFEQAKAEASVWFRARGVSAQGICDYPVMYYLSWDTMNALKDNNVEFSPVGPGC